MFISAGLLYIHSRSKAIVASGLNPPIRAYTTAVWFFFMSLVFSVIVPFVPPNSCQSFRLHCAVGLAIGSLGAVYTVLVCKGSLPAALRGVQARNREEGGAGNQSNRLCVFGQALIGNYLGENLKHMHI